MPPKIKGRSAVGIMDNRYLATYGMTMRQLYLMIILYSVAEL